MDLMLRLEGPQLFKIPPSRVITYLNTTITQHSEVLAVEEGRRLQREEDQRLREEQNREYQETLLEDQMRETERQEVVDRERRAKEEKEEAKRLARAKEENRLEDAKATIEMAGGEPPAGSEGVTRLRFTLPNGKKVDRRFHTADTIGVLRAFLVLHFHEQPGIEIKNFGLSTNFPRKSFGDEDREATLEEAGLAPQAVVMVQDLDA
jgi:FAS-associated factor 2